MFTLGINREMFVSQLELASTPHRLRETVHWLILFAAVILAALANFNLVWNLFYRGVPILFDAGWLAHLTYHSAPLLENPPTVAFASIGRFYYSTHFSPALWVFSWPSYLIPIGPQAWLACLQAIEHALLAVLVWLAVQRFAPNTTGLQRGAAAAIVLLAPFNGIELASMVYPHFESWFVVCSLGFLLALFQGQLGPAVGWFVATLLLREDMGFHLCGLLLLTALAARIVRRRWDREIGRWLGFAALGFLWSCGAVVLVRTFFPGDDALTRVYLGHPAFAHLNRAEIVGRLRFYAEARGYIWMPVAVYGLWAVLSHRWWVLIGYLAFVPWWLLNFVAYSRAPGTLSLYYSFPLGLALLWPLVGHFVFSLNRGELDAGGRATWVAAALLASIVGFVPEGGWASLARMMAFPATGVKHGLEAVASQLAAAAAGGRVVGIDDAVAALEPAAFRATNLFGQTPAKLSLAAFYANGRTTRFAWDVTRELPLHYGVHGTPLIVLSAEPLAWPDLEPISTEAGSILPFLRDASHALTPQEREPESGRRLLCSGPRDWYFRVGEKWAATFTLALAGATHPADVVCEIATRHGNTVIARDAFQLAPPIGGTSQTTREIGFVVPRDQNTGVEIRVQAPLAATVRLEDVALRRSAPAPDDDTAAAEKTSNVPAL